MKTLVISSGIPPSRTQGREGQKILLFQKLTSEVLPQKHKGIYYKKTFLKMKHNTVEKTQKLLLWFKENLIVTNGYYKFFIISQLNFLSS
jgi:hypothetical protein